MERTSVFIRNGVVSLLVAAGFFVCISPSSVSQTVPIRDRVAGVVDNANTFTVHGTVSPLVRRSTDAGQLPGDRKLGQMLLMLSPTKEQNASLESLIKNLHTPSSPKYHQWLKPAEVGARFGVSEQDAAVIQRWLQSEGFEVKRVATSRRFIAFSGTVAQVESAFHTEMHQYSLNGRSFIANATDIQIPAALQPVVRGVVRLNSTPRNADVKLVGKATYDASKRQITFSDGEHAITPADFATIYNLNPLYQNGINGAGQSIAIVARSDFNPRDVFDFFSLFGLPFNGFFLTVNGDDPGFTPDAVEATLDLTWSMALAPGATPTIVISQSNFADGVDISAAFIVDNDLAPVMSTSFSSCEQVLGPVGTEFFGALWAQAAAEGISAVVSSGDNGGAGCDDPGSGFLAQNGLAVSGTASTPFNVVVGGTEFDDTANPSLYWSDSNDPTTKSSALSYIPEKVWNESSIDAANVNLFASGGGVSTVWPKPDWQIGPGVPNDGMRDVPDVALNAAGHDGYVLCFAGSCENGQVFIIAGTSASAPSFAAIMALVNQQTGSPQGTPNFVLYQVAAQHPEIFHDIVNGDNKVPDANGNFTLGFSAGPGYDLATGLGSFDANALVTNWISVQFNSTSTNLTGPASGTFVHGAGVPVTATVTASGGTTPTGNVAFFTDNPLGLSASLGVGIATLDNTGNVNASLKAIPGGTHTLTARYAGDAKFTASTSNSVAVTVTPESSNTFFVAGVGGSIVQSAEAKYGEPITMAVLVQGASGIGHPTGTVNLNEGANFLGSRLLNFGEHEGTQQGASSVFGITGFPAGLHILNASYPGDASFNPSTSADFQLTIDKSDSFFSSLHAQGAFLPNVSVPFFGQVALTSGTLLPISGTVSLSASSGGNVVNLGSAALDATSNTFASSITLPSSGTWVLTVAYSGDANVNPTQTKEEIIVDSTEPTTLTLTSSAPAVAAGGSVTFSAQVSSSVTSLEPTGTVTFMDGTTSLGSATLDAFGIAKLTSSALSGGSHSITANYNGDSVFRSSSASMNQMISDYLLEATAGALTITAGQSGSTGLTVVPEGGFNQAVTFTCSGLPSGDTCSFSPATVTPDGTNVASDTMTVSTAKAAATQMRSSLMLSSFGIGLAGLCLLAPVLNRRKRLGLSVSAGLLLTFGMLGCGGGSGNTKQNQPPPPLIAQVTVTATAASGVAHSTTVSVTIVH